MLHFSLQFAQITVLISLHAYRNCREIPCPLLISDVHSQLKQQQEYVSVRPFSPTNVDLHLRQGRTTEAARCVYGKFRWSFRATLQNTSTRVCSGWSLMTGPCEWPCDWGRGFEFWDHCPPGSDNEATMAPDYAYSSGDCVIRGGLGVNPSFQTTTTLYEYIYSANWCQTNSSGIPAKTKAHFMCAKTCLLLTRWCQLLAVSPYFLAPYTGGCSLFYVHLNASSVGPWGGFEYICKTWKNDNTAESAEHGEEQFDAIRPGTKKMKSSRDKNARGKRSMIYDPGSELRLLRGTILIRTCDQL